jgi:CheY-like chemotaxis protein
MQRHDVWAARRRRRPYGDATAGVAERGHRSAVPWPRREQADTRQTPHRQPERLRVLIVDDSDLFAAGLRLVLEGDGSIQVVGRAHNGRVGVAMASALSPDVVVMDLNMPVMDGIEATRRITEQSAVPVLVLTASPVPCGDEVARAAGACGLLDKQTDGRELRARIREAGAVRKRPLLGRTPW